MSRPAEVRKVKSETHGWIRPDTISIEPTIDMVATVCGWSDRHVYDIIDISKSGKKLTLREREPVLIKKPVMEPGGFCAIVVEPAVWETKSNPEGSTITATYREKYKWFQRKGCHGHRNGNVLLNVDSYFYDYGF